jgi:uncharacterized protein (TIGR02266 family)
MFVREHTRYPVELAVRMKCASWTDYLELYTSNLSRGGLFVPSRMSAPIGTEIAIELTLPNGTLVKLRGEIVHLSEEGGGQIAGMGVMFSSDGAEAARLLEEALALARANAPRPKPLPPPAPVRAAPPPPVRAAPPIPVRVPPPIPTRAAPPIPTRAAPPIPTRAAPPIPTRAAPPAAHDDADVAAAATATGPEARVPRFADAVEQALQDELARRIELAPHEQLGLALDATDADINDAHGRLRERYAPGIFARYGASTAAVVRSINEAVDAAYARLQDANERRRLVVAGHQPKAEQLSPSDLEHKRRGEEARARLRAGIERRVEEACAHRDMDRLDEAISGFEHVLSLDRKHEYARAELSRLRDLKAKRKR